MSKKILALLSIVEQGRGKKLTKALSDRNIALHFQTVGYGTAPSEMMDLFGMGTNDKDIIISLGARNDVYSITKNLSEGLQGQAQYNGLMVVLDITAAGRVVTEFLHFTGNQTTEKETETMQNEHHHNLIVIAVNEGYSEDVMQAARKAGATGGTVLKGRLVDPELFAELPNATVEGEREMLCILAPAKASKQIMEEVNRSFGVSSPANGILFALPAEKAFKI